MQRKLSYLPNPSAPAGYDTRSTFKRSLTRLNSEFSFSSTCCLTKAEEPSLSYYLPIAGGRIIGFVPFPRVLVLCEMQSVLSRIWTRVAVSILYDDNHYTMGTFKESYIAKLTIPLEVNIDWAHQRKLQKYDDLREEYVKNGWSTDIFPLEIGCRGFISISTSTSLTKLGLSRKEKREYIKKDPKQDCNCVWANIDFVQIKLHPIKSASIERYCWGTLG